MGLNRFAKGFFDPLIELYRPVPPLAWAPLIISVLGIDNTGKVFLLFMVSLSIMIISARAGASGTQLSKIHAAHSLGASKNKYEYVIFLTRYQNSNWYKSCRWYVLGNLGNTDF